MFIPTLAQPPSQPCLADTPAPDTGPNPTTSSHPRLSSAEPPLGFGQLHLGTRVQGSQASVPLELRLVGSMLLLQAAWICWGSNSLKSWQPVSGLSIVTTSNQQSRRRIPFQQALLDELLPQPDLDSFFVAACMHLPPLPDLGIYSTCTHLIPLRVSCNE